MSSSCRPYTTSLRRSRASWSFAGETSSPSPTAPISIGGPASWAIEEAYFRPLTSRPITPNRQTQLDWLGRFFSTTLTIIFYYIHQYYTSFKVIKCNRREELLMDRQIYKPPQKCFFLFLPSFEWEKKVVIAAEEEEENRIFYLSYRYRKQS